MDLEIGFDKDNAFEIDELGPEPERPSESLNLPLKSKLPQNFIDSKADSGFHRGPTRRSSYQLIAWSWLAAAIDCSLILSLTLIFTTVFAVIFKTSLSGIVVNSEFIKSSAVLIFAFIAIFYMVIVRSFLGFTLGDWTCRLRLGSKSERFSGLYTLRVLGRSVLMAMTGFVVLPALSLLLGFDVAGSLSGIRLVSLN